MKLSADSPSLAALLRACDDVLERSRRTQQRARLVSEHLTAAIQQSEHRRARQIDMLLVGEEWDRDSK